MYALHPRCVRTFPCIYKTCVMNDNPCMATYTSYHISHLPGDGLVVCRSCQTWFHILGGMLPGWRACSRLVMSFPYINRICENGGNPSIATYTSHHIPYLHGDGLMVCKSCKIWSYSFGGLWFGWKTSMCMCYIRGLADLYHVSVGYVIWMATQYIHLYLPSHPHLPGDGLVVCKS